MTTQSQRLKDARIKAGYDTASDAARALGVSVSTYSAHENGQNGLKLKFARKYAQKFKVSQSWLLTGEEQPLPDSQRQIGLVAVVGKVSAGVPLDVETVEQEWAEMHNKPTVPSATNYPVEWQYCFEVEGQSLNKIAPPGSILICLDLITSGYAVQENDLVIVEHSMFDGQAIERTAKRIKRTSSGYDLWPESTAPEYKDPIAINGNGEAEEYSIKAVVLWILKRP